MYPDEQELQKILDRPACEPFWVLDLIPSLHHLDPFIVECATCVRVSDRMYPKVDNMCKAYIRDQITCVCQCTFTLFEKYKKKKFFRRILF